MLVLRLPPELIQHVLEFGNLSKKDLSLISTASRLFRNEAQRALFRDPGHFYVGLAGDSPRTEAFFNAIISSPGRLALMVRTYAQNTGWYDYSREGYDSSIDYKQEAIFEKMTEAFKLMDNIKRFQSSDSTFNGHFHDRMLSSLSQAFPGLEEFSWHHDGEEPKIIDFLTNRHGIRYLELSYAFGLGNYDHQQREQLLSAARTMCPKLEAISGTVEITKILLPGKSNIRYLRWTQLLHAELKYEAYKQNMLDEMGSLKYLEYKKNNPGSGIPFQIIAPHLRELVFLRMCNKLLIECDPKLFDHLLQLRAIDFFDDTHHATENIPHDHLRRIFLGCKQLRYIDFETKESNDRNYYHSVYRRFTRSPDTEDSLCENLLAVGSQEAAWDQRIALITRLTKDNTLHSVRCT